MKGKKGSIILKTVLSLGGSPRGQFSVYVGPQREKFLARTEWLSHPLFLKLLEEAEMEYGYAKEGPLKLPCDIEVFHRVLGEVAEDGSSSSGCNFARSPFCCFGRFPGNAGYQLLGVLRALEATGK